MTDDRHEEALDTARDQLSTVEKDRLIVKAVNQLDQVEENLEKEMERFRDWYSIHFPELEEEIEEDGRLVDILSENLERSELDAFSSLVDDSGGADLHDKDLEILQDTVEKLEKDIQYRDSLDDYIRKMIKQEMTNLSGLLEPLLAAKMIALSGGLGDLAKSPASTIQMLGAEKALFRHLSGGGEPPKHGILFEHRFVRTLEEDQRGKMARFLANKTAMAARLDQYGEKDRGDELREEAREKFEELKG